MVVTIMAILAILACVVSCAVYVFARAIFGVASQRADKYDDIVYKLTAKIQERDEMLIRLVDAFSDVLKRHGEFTAQAAAAITRFGSVGTVPKVKN